MKPQHHGRSQSADSAQGACTIDVRALPGGASPITIHILHSKRTLWCAVGGQWVQNRDQAARFASNMDAIAYCVALSLTGRVVGVSALGKQLYQLEIDQIVKEFAQPQASIQNPSNPRPRPG